MGDLEITKGEASDAKKRADETEEKVRRDMQIAIHRYRQTKSFRCEADSNYLEGLNECRATIMKAHPEIDFSFIASATNTQPYPNFQAEAEADITPLVSLDDVYEASIDIEESEKRRHVEEEG